MSNPTQAAVPGDLVERARAKAIMLSTPQKAVTWTEVAFAALDEHLPELIERAHNGRHGCI